MKYASAFAALRPCAGGGLGPFLNAPPRAFLNLPALGAVARTRVAGIRLPPRTGKAPKLGEGQLGGRIRWLGSGAASAGCSLVLIAVAPAEGLEPLAFCLHRRHRSADNAARAGVEHEDRIVIPGPGGEAPDGVNRRLHGDAVQVGITGDKVGRHLWRRQGPVRARAAVCEGDDGVSATAPAGLKRGRRLGWIG